MTLELGLEHDNNSNGERKKWQHSKPRSLEYCQKISAALKGKPKSESWKLHQQQSRKGKPSHWQRGVVKDLYAWCNFCGMRQPWQNKRCDECNKMLRHVVRTKCSKQRREANGEVYRY